MEYKELSAEDFENNRVALRQMFGDWGMPPHEPCRECRSVVFRAVGDWDMGYMCENYHRFGTSEEYELYRKSQPR